MAEMYYDIPDHQPGPAPAKLILSSPFLDDLHFKRTVILLTEHNDQGSMGFILNRPTDLTLQDALDDFPAFDAPLYFGGPVQPEIMQFIHKIPNLEDSVEIKKGVYWGGNFDNLKFMIDTGQVLPNDIRFFIGYSGWAPLQLEQEIIRKSWIVSQASKKFIFTKNYQELWTEVLKNMGGYYKRFTNVPEDPSFN